MIRTPYPPTVAQELGVSPRTHEGGPERAVNRLGFADMKAFTQRMTEVQHRVGFVYAAIGSNQRAIGTCLLVGPDLVLTNKHVVDEARAFGIATARPLRSLHAGPRGRRAARRGPPSSMNSNPPRSPSN